MELLCPNCQRKLMIADQYAGQTMKCPLCQGNFQAPALPPAEPALEIDAPPPPPPLPPGGEPLKSAFPESAAPAPGMTAATAVSEQPVSPRPTYQPPPRVGNYTGGFHVTFDPKILQWVPAVALVFIFVLTFFPWVGEGYRSVWIGTQNAWASAFGVYQPDPDLLHSSGLFRRTAVEGSRNTVESPGVSPFLIFFVLLLVPVTALAVAVPVLAIANIRLPDVARLILPWRWVIVAGLAALLFFLLALQVILGFGLERSVRAEIQSRSPDLTNLATTDRKQAELLQAVQLSGVKRTWFVPVVLTLNLLALIAAVLVLWIDWRKTAPLPRIDVLW